MRFYLTACEAPRNVSQTTVIGPFCDFYGVHECVQKVVQFELFWRRVW